MDILSIRTESMNSLNELTEWIEKNELKNDTASRLAPVPKYSGAAGVVQYEVPLYAWPVYHQSLSTQQQQQQQ